MYLCRKDEDYGQQEEGNKSRLHGVPHQAGREPVRRQVVAVGALHAEREPVGRDALWRAAQHDDRLLAEDALRHAQKPGGYESGLP